MDSRGDAVKEMQEKLAEVQRLATRLHALITPGTTIELNWPEIGGLVIPGQPRKMNRIIITRPNIHLMVAARPSAEGQING